jgi:hypothetical protein
LETDSVLPISREAGVTASAQAAVDQIKAWETRVKADIPRWCEDGLHPTHQKLLDAWLDISLFRVFWLSQRATTAGTAALRKHASDIVVERDSGASAAFLVRKTWIDGLEIWARGVLA